MTTQHVISNKLLIRTNDSSMDYFGCHNHTRVGWKVHRLTMKELCHSNETWHALHSTFLILWTHTGYEIQNFEESLCGTTTSTRDISKRPGKLTKLKETCFTRTLLMHTFKSVVAMAAVRDCGFELVDHSPFSPELASSNYFQFPNMKKKTHLAGKQGEAVSDRRWGNICSEYYSRIRMRAIFIPWESNKNLLDCKITPFLAWKKCVEAHRGVCGQQGRLCWKINHIKSQTRPLHHSQPMNFQPTLVLGIKSLYFH